jgi:hypothetical protein
MVMQRFSDGYIEGTYLVSDFLNLGLSRLCTSLNGNINRLVLAIESYFSALEPIIFHPYILNSLSIFFLRRTEKMERASQVLTRLLSLRLRVRLAAYELSHGGRHVYCAEVLHRSVAALQEAVFPHGANALATCMVLVLLSH